MMPNTNVSDPTIIVVISMLLYCVGGYYLPAINRPMMFVIIKKEMQNITIILDLSSVLASIILLTR